MVKVPLVTGSSSTNYIDSEIIKVYRREIKKWKMLVIFLGLSPVYTTRRLRKNKPLSRKDEGSLCEAIMCSFIMRGWREEAKKNVCWMDLSSG